MLRKKKKNIWKSCIHDHPEYEHITFFFNGKLCNGSQTHLRPIVFDHGTRSGGWATRCCEWIGTCPEAQKLAFLGGKIRWNQMGVSENRGTPKSSNLIGISIVNHPFWGTSIFGNTQIQDVWNSQHWSLKLLPSQGHDGHGLGSTNSAWPTITGDEKNTIEQKQEPCENLMFATDSTFFSWTKESFRKARKARKCKVESKRKVMLQPSKR